MDKITEEQREQRKREQLKKAKRKYQQKLRRLTVTLYPADADIQRHIEEREARGLGYAEYIRQLIREDMSK